jgi:hypothetical protein
MRMKSLAYVLYILLAGALPDRDRLIDQVDIIEIHHFINDDGTHSFSQIIFWEIAKGPNGRDEEKIVAWRLLRRCGLPRRCYRTGTYVVRWHDEDTSQLREVVGKRLRERMLTYDPERRNKEIFPEESRRGLKMIVPKKRFQLPEQVNQ